MNDALPGAAALYRVVQDSIFSKATLANRCRGVVRHQRMSLFCLRRFLNLEQEVPTRMNAQNLKRLRFTVVDRADGTEKFAGDPFH